MYHINIKYKSRAFRVLGDCDKVYQFMVSIYERDRRNGIEASFFEYAYVSFSCWMDITYSYKNRIWEDNGEIVAFCFYESPITEIYFCLKPRYEELASEMIAYADKNMIHKGEVCHGKFINRPERQRKDTADDRTGE